MATGNTYAIPTWGEVIGRDEALNTKIKSLSATTQTLSYSVNNKLMGEEITQQCAVETDQDIWSEMTIKAIFCGTSSLCFFSIAVVGRYLSDITFRFDRNDDDIINLTQYFSYCYSNAGGTIVFSTNTNVKFNLTYDEYNGAFEIKTTGTAPTDYTLYNFLMTPTPTYLGKSYYKW